MDSGNWRVKRDPSDAPVGQSTPNRSFQQRRPNNGFGSSPRSPAFGGSSGQSSPMRGSPFRKPLNEPAANAAIEEGRRLYVGNLPYGTSLNFCVSLRSYSRRQSLYAFLSQCFCKLRRMLAKAFAGNRAQGPTCIYLTYLCDLTSIFS